jgi:hypothetical protein
MTESQAREKAKAAIEKCAPWFCYMNPVIGLTVSIQRSLLDAAAKQLGMNHLDAASAVAGFAQQHLDRLAGLNVGQSEGFLETPFKAHWHVLLIDGQAYVADQEFYPYQKELVADGQHRTQIKHK